MKFSEITVKHQALLGVVNMTLPRKVSVAVSRNLSKIEKEKFLFFRNKNLAPVLTLDPYTGA